MLNCLFCCRSTASFLKASKPTNCLTDFEAGLDTSGVELDDKFQGNHRETKDFQLPIGDWLNHSWLKQGQKHQMLADTGY